MVTILKERRDFITPRRWGAKMDAVNLSNNNCTQGSAIVTNTTDSPFSRSHVGKTVYVQSGLLNGSTLVTTVLSYQSATQITLATNVLGATGTKRIVIGTDDTAALTKARAYARARAKAVIIDGAMISGPQKLTTRDAIIGESRMASHVYLKPNSATTDKFLFGVLNATDYNIAIQDLTLNGLRDFNTNGSGVMLTDINVIDHVGSGADTLDVHVYNLYQNLRIREGNRAALKYAGKGQSKFVDLILTHSTYGIDINSADNLLEGIDASAYGAAFYLGSGVTSSRFVGCRGFFGGNSPQSGASGAGEVACWYLNGASNNEFTNCEGEEGWASIWVLSSANKNMFSSCRAADPGCVYGSHGLGSTNAGEIRAGFRINASSDNHFSGSSVGIGSHSATSYASHAVYTEGACNDNVGRLSVDRNMTFATTKIGRTHTGERNSLVIDDEPMDVNDDSYIDNQRFIAGSFF